MDSGSRRYRGSARMTNSDGSVSGNRDDHGGEGHKQNSNRSHEHRHAGRQCPDEAIAACAEGCPMRSHARNCGSRLHHVLLNAPAQRRTGSVRRLLRCPRDERSHEHDEAESQPEQLCRNDRRHNTTHTPLHGKASRNLVLPAVLPVHLFCGAGTKIAVVQSSSSANTLTRHARRSS